MKPRGTNARYSTMKGAMKTSELRRKRRQNESEATENHTHSSKTNSGGYVFKQVAEKCPWREDLGGVIGCAAVTMGITVGRCKEENCGLLYIVKTTNLVNT